MAWSVESSAGTGAGGAEVVVGFGFAREGRIRFFFCGGMGVPGVICVGPVRDGMVEALVDAGAKAGREAGIIGASTAGGISPNVMRGDGLEAGTGAGRVWVGMTGDNLSIIRGVGGLAAGGGISIIPLPALMFSLKKVCLAVAVSGSTLSHPLLFLIRLIVSHW